MFGNGTINPAVLEMTHSKDAYENESSNSSSSSTPTGNPNKNPVPYSTAGPATTATRSKHRTRRTASALRLGNTSVVVRSNASPFPTAATTTATAVGTTLAAGTTTPVQATSASQLKRSYDVAAGLSVGGKRLTGEFDPENQEIKRLRQEEDLDFDKIADKMNEARCKRGKEGGFTANAVYSPLQA